MRCFSIILHPEIECLLYFSLENPLFHLFFCLYFLCLFICALPNCCVHPFDAADPERLQHFSNLLLLWWLQQPDHALCERLRIRCLIDECGLMRVGLRDYMEILVSACPQGSPVMDDSVNVCDFRAGWSAKEAAASACTFPSATLP